jgi:hypothetical protein
VPCCFPRPRPPSPGFNGANEIKQHPFFASIDWEKLYKKEVEPPFKPTLTGLDDMRYFDRDFLRMEASGACCARLLLVDGDASAEDDRRFGRAATQIRRCLPPALRMWTCFVALATSRLPPWCGPAAFGSRGGFVFPAALPLAWPDPPRCAA